MADDTGRAGGTGMRLTVIGTGYLGLTHAVAMAALGHDVLGLDADADKVRRASHGEVPFFEPGLEPLLRKNVDAGRLRFTTSFAEAARFGDVHFLCVGTPQAADGSADLRYLYAAADALAAGLRRPCLVVGKSTVPVGTARAIAGRIAGRAPAGARADAAWNPEFLREAMPSRTACRLAASSSA
jgi:UDPglucose 6-dehydrogenase